MDAQLEPVDHDPFADNVEPVEHDPFAGDVLPPATLQQLFSMFEKSNQRLLSIEMAVAQAVFEIRGALAGMGANVQHLHASHEKLRQVMAAPKRIVRDENGRPTGVVVDQSL